MRLARALCFLVACLFPLLAPAQAKTVCTITINSADEQQTFRRFLPPGEYEFVELVERNRPDWLRSACEAKVACDVLLVSGHYGEGDVFFSDDLDRSEFLPISELERVACSNSCPGLFANLQEVYLFGCDTLSPRAQHTVSDEVVRSYIREGYAPADARRLAQALGSLRGESSRDRMRLVFRDVPVIYGFSSAAPLGPVAARSLDRYFRRGGASEVGGGRASKGLLQQFSPFGMVTARGIRPGDPLQALRQDICSFADDRLAPADTLEAVHELLQRPTPQARLLLGRIERVVASLDASRRAQPDIGRALGRIARDQGARGRWLAFARDADQPGTRVRMVEVARALGWLSAEERRQELVRMFQQLLARSAVAGPDVALACSLNQRGELDGALGGSLPRSDPHRRVGHSALLACMGSAEARTRVIEALVSPDDSDVRIAQFYLRHRPLAAGELHAVAQAIAGMQASAAQARALDVLARHYVADAGTIEVLERLYASTRSGPVQDAIAGVLVRADPRLRQDPGLLHTLRAFRLESLPEGSMVDALIARVPLS